ncbi:ABC transporter permease [uncultured Jatrophihabitans sp.]|uniref:ABC transporter permease n=1 Tax=uncultured Jatrophihabitans sp. TaxID=1610747 RepID=UPI0035CB7391
MSSDVILRKPGSAATEPPAEAPRARWRSAARWESGLVVVLIGVLIFGSVRSPTFTNPSTIFFLGINTGYIAIMALPMTFVVMTGEIDLSVASMLGLSGATVGYLWHHGWGIWPCFLVALLVGVVGGALNGILVAKVGLPSIAVTIGTLTLFRGLAEVLLGSDTIPGIGDREFPSWLTNIGANSIPGSQFSWSMVIFVVLAVIFGIVLHFTTLGRSMVAIGLQPEAAEFAGIRVNRIKLWLFVLSGVLSAFAGILLTMQNASVSYSAGTGLELNVVAIVLFGGVSIFGGRGTIVGVVLSVAIVGSLQMALTQINVSADKQNIVTGVLLLISVIVPNGPEAVRRLRDRFRRPTRLA